MKKLIAFVLVLMVVLNALVLWPREEAAETNNVCTATTIELPDTGTGLVPVLMKF